MKRNSFFVPVLISLAMVVPAFASTVVFYNLEDAGIGDRSLLTPEYQSFSTGAGSFSLTDVQVLLNGSPTDSNTFSVGLYADSSTTPGSLLVSLGTLSDMSLTSSCNCIYDFVVTPFALSASTRYWIGLTETGASNANWEIEGGFVTPPGDIEALTEFHDDTGTVGPDVSGGGFLEAFQMQVTVSPTVVVSGAPEPSTLLFGGAGLVVLGLVRRLRS